MELYQIAIVGLIGLLLTLMLLENERINKVVWNDLITMGRHVESVLHPTYWRDTDPGTWEFVVLDDGQGIIPRVDWPAGCAAAWNSPPYDVDSPYYGHRN